MYLTEVQKIDAVRNTALLEAASYPYMKKGDRRKVEKKYERIFKRDVMPSREEAKSTWKFLRKRYKAAMAKKKQEKK